MKDKEPRKNPGGIRGWPESERPRELLNRLGAAALSDAQLLAILLRTGRRQKTAFDMACDLLSGFGGLESLGRAAAAELRGLKGLGPAKTAQILAAVELGRRAVSVPPKPGTKIRSSGDLYRRYSARLADLRKEVFILVMCDAKNRVQRDETVSTGSLSLNIVHPREVFRPAVREAASSVFFLHNHPSGDPAPSPEDRELTRRLVQAGRIMGIRVLDHVIVGRGKYYSFADQGSEIHA